MADIDHPKTHVEDQDLDEPRKQPKSPQHEGIDPLTESDTMYPREDVKGNAEKLAKKEEKEAVSTPKKAKKSSKKSSKKSPKKDEKKDAPTEDPETPEEEVDESETETPDETPEDTTVEDQEERNAVANTPNKVLNDDAPKSKSTGSTASSR